MENQYKIAYSPTTPAQGLYVIVPWAKTEFKHMSCSEYFDENSCSVE